jgi:hypothetical protein
VSEFNQAEYRRLKTRLTAKKNKFDAALAAGRAGRMIDGGDTLIAAARALITECDHANVVFYEAGYPDDWTNWERAKNDAEMHLRRMGARA